MKAIILKQYGSPRQLELGELPKPSPARGEVLIRVHAVSINDWDWGLVRGKPFVIRMIHGLKKPKIKIPGVDVAGTVEALGEGVSTLNVGDKVYGDLSDGSFGAFAEYVCAPEKALRVKPASISFAEAAALPHAGLLAWQALFPKGKLKAVQRVLINGAGGGVGTLAIQMLKPYKLKVTGVDSAEKLAMLKSQGFDQVLNYKDVDFTATGEQYDLILDTKTNRSSAKYARALKKNGRYITVGGGMNRLFELLFLGSFFSFFSRKKLSILSLKPNEGLEHISQMVEQGQLLPVVDGPYGFAEIPALIQYFGEGKHRGKIVVELKK